MAYDFHYTPTGTGVISGKEVLEQTEDAINDLGNTAISGVQEALDKAEQALTNSENAVDDAQTALNTANNAEGVAIQAQTDVSNLSGTVTNIGNRVTTAEGNISNLQGRMTTAEGNITNLQGRMTTAEGNIGNLQTAVSTAQATANSAQQTATTARQQSYVFRYSGTAVVPNSTIAYSTIDNTDNIKSGDKILDVDGKLFEITAVDTTNQTVTVGTALIDLALDANVVHTSGNETIGGVKTFTDFMQLKSNVAEYGVTEGNIQFYLVDKNNFSLSKITQGVYNNGVSYITLQLYGKDSNNQTVTNTIRYQYSSNFDYSYVLPTDNGVWLGSTGNRWGKIYGIQYYYGSNNVEFSTKFVTTDTNQTISGTKTFDGVNINFKSKNAEYSVTGDSKDILFLDKNSTRLAYFRQGVYSSGLSYQTFNILGYDSNNQQVSQSITFGSGNLGLSTAFLKPDTDNAIALGRSNNKWSDVQTYKVNALEPSSLSLPSDRSARIDISSYFTNTGTGNTNNYSVPANGFIFLNLLNTFAVICHSIDGTNNINYAQSFFRQVDGQIYILFPVRKNDTFRTLWTSNGGTITVTGAHFIPCLGNV